MNRSVPFAPRSFAHLAGIVAVAAAFASAPLAAGWRMVQVVTNTGSPNAEMGNSKTRMSIEGGAAKVEFLETQNPMFGVGTYILAKEPGAQMFIVNPAEKTYSRFDVDSMMGMAASMEQSMAQSGANMKIEILDPKFEKVSEGPGPVMLGYPTVHAKYRSSHSMVMSAMGMKLSTIDTQSDEEVWVAPTVDLAQGVRGGGEGAAQSLLDKFGEGSMVQELRKISEVERGKLVGFPLKRIVKTRTKSQSKFGGGGGDTTTTTTEVLELAQVRFGPEELAIPRGYSEKDMMQGGPAMPDLSDDEE